MSPTTPHRAEVLREVISVAELRADGVLPMDVPGVQDTFGDETTLLGALQLRWHSRLTGRVEQALADEPEDLPGAVVRAWQDAAAEMAGVRAVIDRCLAAPADETMAEMLGKATAKERAMLAVAAGLASATDAAAVAAGELLVQRARTERRTTTRHSQRTSASLALVRRIRKAVHAA